MGDGLWWASFQFQCVTKQSIILWCSGDSQQGCTSAKSYWSTRWLSKTVSLLIHGALPVKTVSHTATVHLISKLPCHLQKGALCHAEKQAWQVGVKWAETKLDTVREEIWPASPFDFLCLHTTKLWQERVRHVFVGK